MMLNSLFAVDILTASSNGNYFSLVDKVKNRCQTQLNPIPTNGSIDNIKKIINSNNSQYALVQSDVFDFFKQISDKKSIDKIKFIEKLTKYTEVIYVIKNKNIKELKKLDSKYSKLKIKHKISVGVFGSGSSVTGYNILTALGLNHFAIYKNKEEALDMLLNNDLGAIIYVSKYDIKNQKLSKWVSKIIKQYGDYVELIDIDLKSSILYKKTVNYKNNSFFIVPTLFISTDINETRNREIYKCINY